MTTQIRKNTVDVTKILPECGPAQLKESRTEKCPTELVKVTGIECATGHLREGTGTGCDKAQLEERTDTECGTAQATMNSRENAKPKKHQKQSQVLKHWLGCGTTTRPKAGRGDEQLNCKEENVDLCQALENYEICDTIISDVVAMLNLETECAGKLPRPKHLITRKNKPELGCNGREKCPKRKRVLENQPSTREKKKK